MRRGCSVVAVLLQLPFHGVDYNHEISLWCQGWERDDAEYLVLVVRSSTRMVMVHLSLYQNARLFKMRLVKFMQIYKRNHDLTYTAVRLRLWAIMIQVGMHKEQDDCPKVPMFEFNSKSPKNSGTNLTGTFEY